MKRNKIFTALLTLLLLVSSAGSAFAAYPDVRGDSPYAAALERLASLGIMKGMEDGSFRPEEPVTKEQFAAIMVNAAGLTDQANASRNGSVYSDVEEGSWSIGYINAAMKAGFIAGNPDGTFGPLGRINLAQAATIMVKALGYTNQDVTGAWPGNYIEKARSLELIEGMDFSYTAELPRWAVAVMIDRLLGTDMKKSSAGAAAVTFAEASELGTVKEYIITSTGEMDASLASGKIRTDQGELTTTGINLDGYLGYKVKLLLNADDKVCAVVGTAFPARGLTVNSIVGNTVKYYEGMYENSVEFPENMPVYYQGAKKTFKDVRNNVVQGSIMALAYDEASPSTYEYGVLVDPDMGTPVVARKDLTNNDNWIGPIDISDKANLVVVKNGSAAAITDIKNYDVVYSYKDPYSKKTTLYVYDDKITGRYDEALPGKAAVNQIRINGETLDIETVSAARKLGSAAGAFNLGDRITVLTGRDGKIVDVMVPYSSDFSNYGVVLNTTSEISTEEETAGKKIYKVKLLKSDGTITDYIQSSTDCTGLKGQPVKYEMNDDIMEVRTAVGYLPGVTGSPDDAESIMVDKSSRKIGKSLVTVDAVLFNVVNRNTNSAAKDADVRILHWEDIPSGLLETDKVMYAGTTGPFQDIQMLVFDNLGSQAGQYGVLLNENTRSGSYTIMVGGTSVTYNTGSHIFYNHAGDVVYLEFKDGTISSMTSLAPGSVSRDVQAVDSQRIKVSGEVFDLASDVAVYRQVTNNIMSPLSLYDIVTDGSMLVKLYFDKEPEKGGKVRIILVN